MRLEKYVQSSAGNERKMPVTASTIIHVISCNCTPLVILILIILSYYAHYKQHTLCWNMYLVCP
jgi:hypothetical protein